MTIEEYSRKIGIFKKMTIEQSFLNEHKLKLIKEKYLTSTYEDMKTENFFSKINESIKAIESRILELEIELENECDNINKMFIQSRINGQRTALDDIKNAISALDKS